MTGLSYNISLYEFCIHNKEYEILLNMWSKHNLPLTPHDISIKSFQLVYWDMDNKLVQASVYGMLHRLKSEIHGRKPVEHSLLEDNRLLCDEWDTSLNKFNPKYYTPRSHEEVFWVCKEHGSYALPIDWRNRVNGRGCPLCNAGQSSYPEQLLYVYLSKTFKSTVSRFKIDNLEYDIYIPEIKLAIEYDGYPWHIGKLGMHTLKKAVADAHGITLLNIAEYKDVLDEVKESYNVNNVTFYKPNYSYSNIGDITNQIRQYVIVNYGIDIDYVDLHIEKQAKIRSKKSVQYENSIEADKPWIIPWVVQEDRERLQYISRSGAKDKIKLQCPNCRELLGEKTPHVISSQFKGCRFCKFTGTIPKEQIDKVQAKWDKSNYKKKLQSM